MLYREKQKEINEWLEKGKEALLITGARQVGKTYLIRETLKQSEYDYVEINLIKNPEYIEMFNYAISKDSSLLLEQLSVIANRPLKKKNTVIFIDEVQESKEILTAIKFLVDEGSFKYILSGSLLGVELVNLRSAPVGSLITIEMYPLTFKEFLIANGLDSHFINVLKDCFINKLEVNPTLHEKVLEAFYRYLIVGGMPKAVSTYLATNDFMATSSVHKEIISEYLKDFTKYEENRSLKLKLIKTYNLIPAELNDQNKRYIFNHLDKNIKFDRYENSFNWLIDSGVALPVFNVTEPKIPLEINKQSNLFKLFLSDVGMLTTEYGRATMLKILKRDKDINYGAAFENFIAQELVANGYKCFYYNSKKYGELDFIIEHLDNILPIKVKSGKNYLTHSALDKIMNVENFDIKSSYVFSTFNVKVEGKITYYPIYMIMFVNEDLLEVPQLEKLDFTNIK